MMTKKAQGLPITTVVLIAVAVMGLAVILIFLFTSQSSSAQSTGTFLNLSQNQSVDACVAALAFGGCPTDKACCSSSTGKCVDCSKCGNPTNKRCP